MQRTIGVPAYRSQDIQLAEDYPELYPPDGGQAPYDFAPIKAYNLQAKVQKKGWEVRVKYSEHSNNTYWGNVATFANFDDGAITQTELMTLYGRHNWQISDRLQSITLLLFMNYVLNNDTNFNHQFSGFVPQYKYAESQRYSVNQDFSYELNQDHKLSFGLVYEYFDLLPIGSNFTARYDPNKEPSEQDLMYPGTTLPIQFSKFNYKNYGIYLQDNWEISKKWRFVWGLRYDHNSRYGDTTNPRVSLIFKPDQNNIFKLLYGHGFLAPSPSDTYRTWGSFSHYDGSNWVSFFAQVPNHDLEPQKARTLTIHLWTLVFRKSLPEIYPLLVSNWRCYFSNTEIVGWGYISYADGTINYFDGANDIEKDMPFFHKWSFKGTCL